ncbi:hypothetical protein Tco_0353357 [Tanacetum coccineum]
MFLEEVTNHAGDLDVSRIFGSYLRLYPRRSRILQQPFMIYELFCSIGSVIVFCILIFFFLGLIIKHFLDFFFRITVRAEYDEQIDEVNVLQEYFITPLLIPYGRFSKVIIYYLASNNNVYRRPDFAVHHTGDDFILGNLKFVPKGETVEVFGMAIPDPLITESIQQSSYYPKYLEMVTENTKKTPQESASEQPATKRAPPKKPTTTTLVKPSKPAPAPTKKPSDKCLITHIFYL